MWDGSNNQKGKIRIRCDNLSGDLGSSQTAFKKTFSAKLQEIKKIASLLKNGLQISLSHIKDHQDDAEIFKI